MSDETAKRFSHLKWGACTDVGRKRHNNEDSHGEWPAQGVFCVADGMGGAEGGEVASRAIVESLSGPVQRFSRFDPPLSQADRAAAIARCVDAASAWIKSYADSQGAKGCGSTFAGVAFDPADVRSAVALHAGDSRVYRIRGKKIAQITRDHSVAEMAGVKDERELSPMFRSMILRAVGIKPRVELDSTAFDVQEGDIVLICSDGLSRMVEDREIARIAASSSDPGSVASALVDRANELGGKDNVTVVAVRVGPASVPSRPVHARLAPAEIDVLVSGGASGGDGTAGSTGDATVSMETLSTGDTATGSMAGGAGTGPTTDDEVVIPDDEDDAPPPSPSLSPGRAAAEASPPADVPAAPEVPTELAARAGGEGGKTASAVRRRIRPVFVAVPAMLSAALVVGIGVARYRAADDLDSIRQKTEERISEIEEEKRKAEEAERERQRLAEEKRKAEEAERERQRLAEEKRKAEAREKAEVLAPFGVVVEPGKLPEDPEAFFRRMAAFTNCVAIAVGNAELADNYTKDKDHVFGDMADAIENGNADDFKAIMDELCDSLDNDMKSPEFKAWFDEAIYGTTPRNDVETMLTLWKNDPKMARSGSIRRCRKALAAFDDADADARKKRWALCNAIVESVSLANAASTGDWEDWMKIDDGGRSTIQQFKRFESREQYRKWFQATVKACERAGLLSNDAAR